MQEFQISDPERDEDGSFIVELKGWEGQVLAVGKGATLEEALEDAKSKALEVAKSNL